MADYYSGQAQADPFGWIKVHPLMTPESMGGFPFDHAGQGETSLMLAMFPELVDTSRLAGQQWYTRSAAEASAEFGAAARDRIVERLRTVLL